MAAKQPKRKSRSAVDSYGRTPLHYAAADGDVVLVEQLLSSGVAADAADDNGWTALHFAAQSNSELATKLLLRANASIDARDSHGNTPLAKAVFNSRGDGGVIGVLRANGADPHAENNYGVSPLKLARTIANYDVQQFFQDLLDDE